jgi:hypothetical protein
MIGGLRSGDRGFQKWQFAQCDQSHRVCQLNDGYKVLFILQYLRALNLKLFTLPSNFDFLRMHQD